MRRDIQFPQALAGARAAGLALFAAALLAACGSDESPQTPAATPAASRLVVDTGSAAPVAGGTLTLKATLLAADGTEVKGATFAWTSSDPTVATVVSASDKAPAAVSASVMAAAAAAPVGTCATVQTLAVGAADITATATLADGSRVTSVTHLVVQAAPAKSYTLVLTPATVAVTAGGAAQSVTVAVRRSDGVDGVADLTNWSWTSDDASSVATVAADGRSAQIASPLSATAAGVAALTACAVTPSGGRLCANAALTRGAAPTVYTVGGTVTGLASGKSLQLADVNGDTQVVSSNGVFTMPTRRANATSYAVTVAAQPAGQTCKVAGASGTVLATNVLNVAVTCVQAQFVVVANRDDRTLSVYRVDPSTGALAVVPGSPFARNGLIADIAFLPSGLIGFAITSDTDELVPFTVEPSSGAIEFRPAATTYYARGGQALALDPSGTAVYVGTSNAFVVRYPINGASVTVPGWVPNIGDALAPGPIQGLVVSASGQSVYAANMRRDAIGVLPSDLSTISQRITSGGTDPGAIALSPNGLFAYTPNRTTNTIGVATLDAVSAQIVATNTFPTAISGATDIALTPSGQYAYVLGSASNSIARHLIDLTTGASATTMDVTPAGSNGRRLRIEPNGRFLYAPSFNGTLYAFAIDGATGALTAVPGSPFATGNGNVAIAIVEPKP